MLLLLQLLDLGLKGVGVDLMPVDPDLQTAEALLHGDEVLCQLLDPFLVSLSGLLEIYDLLDQRLKLSSLPLDLPVDTPLLLRELPQLDSSLCYLGLRAFDLGKLVLDRPLKGGLLGVQLPYPGAKGVLQRSLLDDVGFQDRQTCVALLRGLVGELLQTVPSLLPRFPEVLLLLLQLGDLRLVLGDLPPDFLNLGLQLTYLGRLLDRLKLALVLHEEVVSERVVPLTLELVDPLPHFVALS